MENSDCFDKKEFLKLKPRLFVAQRITTSVPLASHTPFPCNEFTLFTKGNGKLITEQGMSNFNEGDFFIGTKGLKRGIFFEHGGEMLTVAISFKEAMQPLIDETYFFSTGKYFETFRSLMELIIHETQNRFALSKYLFENLLKSLLICIIRATGPQELSENKSSAFIGAKEYFDNNYLNLDNIDSVCKNLGINKFYLTHLFKENLGKPPIKYLIDKRMELAKKLLDETNKSISMIAKDCGYSDVAYFCRIFKKTVGTTPLKYRRLEK